MGRASVLATGFAGVSDPPEPPGPGVGTDEGLSVGNRPAALPPGLRLEVVPPPPPPPMVGRVPTGTCVTLLLLLLLPVPVPPAVLPVEDGDGDVVAPLWLTVTGMLTDGCRTSCAEAPATVSWTEVIDVAVVGTVMLART
jgi:hypothetical protein